MSAYTGAAEVKGFYERIRNTLQPILIVLFLVAPWIQIQGQPLFLLDFFDHRLIFFGTTFYSHEAPLLFFLIILIVMIIFLVTALFGRLWCGWACPQTVFINTVFNRIERLIIGTYAQRILFYKSEDSLKKIVKLLSLYSVFLALCWVLSHSFVAYFLGANKITAFILDGPMAHKSTFIVCTIMTGVLFFNFAFFREKLCIYVCPYGRFQNALIDQNSLVVSYDQIRGEPRSKISTYTAEKGDCIDCRRCVNVCPVKIDIRDGFQFDCIACGQCIDACDAVMKKLNRPERLIRYETGDQKPVTLKRFRLGLYTLLILLFSLGFAWSLYSRAPIDMTLSRAHQLPFTSRIEDGRKILQNQIQLHIQNQTQTPLRIRLLLSPENQADAYKISSPANDMLLEPGQDIKTSAFIEISAEQFVLDKNEVTLILRTNDSELHKHLKFIRQD